MDYASFSPADMRLNNSVFQWHFRMPEVFEEHKKIINANRVQYENSLKVLLFSLIFLQSTLFKTDTYEAGTNKGAFHLSELTAQTQVLS